MKEPAIKARGRRFDGLTNRLRLVLRRRRLIWTIAWITATIGLAVFVRSIDLQSAWQHIVAAKIGWIMVALVANFLTLPVMTEQWFRLVPRGAKLRRGALWECVTVGMAAMNALPFGGGHAVAVGMLATRGTTIDGGVSLMALEQLCDGVAKFAILLAALAVMPLSPPLERLPWIVGILVIGGFAGLLWLAKHPLGGTTGWRTRWARHLEAVRRPGVLVAAIGLSLCMKMLMLVAIYAAQRALRIEVSFSHTPVVLAVVTFATAMAIAPGNLGIYEMATIAAYRLLGVSYDEAAVLGLVQHACFLVPMLGTGYAVTLWRVITPKERPPRRDARDSAAHLEFRSY
jgi:uncharacterized membrane protein YbhN (UPF0104 family)